MPEELGALQELDELTMNYADALTTGRRISVTLASVEPKILFEATGSKTGLGSTLLLTLVVLGVIGSLSMLIVAFIIPVGSPLIYVVTLALSIALGVWVFKKDNVTIQIVQDGGIRAVIRGPTTNLDEPLELGSDHWVSFERVPLKMGGGTLVRYSATAMTKGGRRIGFNLRAGAKGTEPADWPERAKALGDGTDVFMCMRIQGLPVALRGEIAT